MQKPPFSLASSNLYCCLQEKFVKQWECLACSLEALAALTSCNLFLNESVTSCDFCCLYYTRFPHLQHPNVDYVVMEKCGPLLDLYGMLEVTSYSSPVLLGLENEVQEAWPFVQWFFGGYGISCTLHTAERGLTFSTTRRTMDLDIVHKAGDFLELLAGTCIPATKTRISGSRILNGRLQHEVIKTGFQYGGLCTKFEIEKAVVQEFKFSFVKILFDIRMVHRHLQACLKCDVYIHESSVAVGTSDSGLRLFRSVVECCFIKNEDPLIVARRLKLDGRVYRLMKKIQALCL
ncbi:hypothetical protein M0R45_023856 [Rubus argutus]|uniref:Uncharacterized protein n=1 Tax=Rubus argutus TaxID=59490 RepID=A0AAW1WTL0_RUBAR